MTRGARARKTLDQRITALFLDLYTLSARAAAIAREVGGVAERTEAGRLCQDIERASFRAGRLVTAARCARNPALIASAVAAESVTSHPSSAPAGVK